MANKKASNRKLPQNQALQVLKCDLCGATRSNKTNGHRPFDKQSLKSHRKSCRQKILREQYDSGSEFEDPALQMADLLASDESDGVYWGIAFEHGYFG